MTEENVTQLHQVDESALRAQADRGEDARKIIESPVFQDAFQAVEASIITKLKESSMTDTEAHKVCRLGLGLLDNLKKGLETHMINGEHSRKQLTQIKDGTLLSRIRHRV